MGKKNKENEEIPMFIIIEKIREMWKFIKDNLGALTLIAIFITALATLLNVI